MANSELTDITSSSNDEENIPVISEEDFDSNGNLETIVEPYQDELPLMPM